MLRYNSQINTGLSGIISCFIFIFIYLFDWFEELLDSYIEYIYRKHI